MAQIKFPEYEIWIDAPDVTFNGTVVKRKIKTGALHVDYPNRQVVINYTIFPFAKNSDGTYGESLAGNPLFTVSVGKFVASNDSLVTQTGGVLGNVVSAIYGQDGKLAPESIIKLWNVAESMTLAEAEAPAVLAEDGVTVVTPAGPLYGVNFWQEWDFYFYTSENMEVKVGDLVRNTFATAIAGGRI